MAIATVTTRCRVTIPKQLRDQLGIHGGQVLECFIENGKIKFVTKMKTHSVQKTEIVSAANK